MGLTPFRPSWGVDGSTKNRKKFWAHADRRIERESGQYSGTGGVDRGRLAVPPLSSLGFLFFLLFPQGRGGKIRRLGGGGGGVVERRPHKAVTLNRPMRCQSRAWKEISFPYIG